MRDTSTVLRLSEAASLIEIFNSRGITRNDLARLEANNGDNPLMDRIVENIKLSRRLEASKECRCRDSGDVRSRHSKYCPRFARAFDDG